LQVVDLADATALDRPKAEAALGKVRIAAIEDPASPEFDAAYAMLDRFFGPRSEMEERAVLQRFLRERELRYSEHQLGIYAMFGAWAGHDLVGVRDCYIDFDFRRRFCMVALSHSFVVPEWRRSGLAALFRALPVTLAKAASGPRLGENATLWVTAEMEPADATDPDTEIRLVAYGRSGFGVLDPSRFHYSQPDFRCTSATITGFPLLGVVRVVGAPVSEIPADLCQAYPELYHCCHRMYLPAWRVDPSEDFAVGRLRADPDPVPLLPLPTARDDAAFQPLRREVVVPRYPPGLRGFGTA
jgi:hypothetical protein